MDLRTCRQENKATICLWCLFVPGSVVSYFILFKKRFSGCSICIHTCYIYMTVIGCVCACHHVWFTGSHSISCGGRKCGIEQAPMASDRSSHWCCGWHGTHLHLWCWRGEILCLRCCLSWLLHCVHMLVFVWPKTCKIIDLPGKKKKKSSRSKYNTSTINYLFFGLFFVCFSVYTLT